MYVDGLFSTLTKGLTKASKFVTETANPILDARVKFGEIKSMWNNPLATTAAAPGVMSTAAAPARAVTWAQAQAAPAGAAASLRNGAQIRELQTLLQGMGINPGPIDGLYGTKTAAGIRQFQGLAGLPQTGKATVNVLDVLRMTRQSRARAPAPLPPARLPPPPLRSAPPLPQVIGAAASLRNGAQVQELQTLLQGMGINPGPIDGLYGTKTAAGIRQFQGLAGLPQTGKATAGLLAVARSMASAVRAKAPARRPFPTSYPAPAPVPAPQSAVGRTVGTPAWVIPVAVGGAALLLLGVASQGRR